MGGKCAVGGVEDMVAFVEHQAARQQPFLAVAPGRLNHHQGVVRDNRAGVTRAPDSPLDEACTVVWASGIDALAAAVGETQRAAPAHQLRQPTREVAAHHIAIAALAGPAHEQPDGDRVGRAHR